MGLTFDETTHRYELDGAWVPSVTETLKASGLIDFSQIPGAVLLRARDRGSRVHRAIHFMHENDLDWDTVDEDDKPRIAAWQSFIATRRFEVSAAELRVFSRRHRFAGTLDCLGVLDGVGALVDFKCGEPTDVAADLQTAAYLGAYMEMLDQPEACDLPRFTTVRRFAVQLRKDGTFELEAYQDPRDYTKFIALLNARRIVEERRGEFEAWLGAA